MFASLLLLTVLAGSPSFEAVARASGGTFGVSAVLAGTGKSVQFHGDRYFPMQSVYKFPIGMAVLNDVDHGALKLDQVVQVTVADLVPLSLHSPIRDNHPRGTNLTVRELMRFMVSESDGTASDVLLRMAGGPARVTGYLRGLGIDQVTVATSEAEMARDDRAQYRNKATPHGMTQLLLAFQAGRGLSPSARVLLLELMTKTESGPQRLKGMLPAGTVVAHKTGTSNTVNGFTAATNDAGLVTLPDGRVMAIAVFVSDSRGDTASREHAIASASRTAFDWFAAGPLTAKP